MLDGLYAAAAGMEAQQQQLDSVANDLSNVSTPGYQATVLGFHDLLYSSGGPSSGSTVATGAGAAAELVGRSQLQGAIQSTGRSLDVAITGPGYIEVRRTDGTIGLTRNGALQVDGAGRLTADGGELLNPPITLPAGVGAADVKIAPDGTVTGGGRTLGRIALVDVAAPDNLLADGGSVFSATAASGPLRPAAGAQLTQGALEQSNVDVAGDMAKLLDAQRSYSLASRAMQYQDQMMQIANGLRS